MTIPTDPPLLVSDEAAAQFKQRLTDRGTPEAMVRFGVRGGACSGLQYHIAYEDAEPRARDTVWEKNDVCFIIDKKSLIYLRASRVVWRSSLMWKGFEFENPQERSRCGCGISFSIE